MIYTSQDGKYGVDNTDGVHNFWNYSEGSSSGQAYDALQLSSGYFTVDAPLHYNESADNFSGYISSDVGDPIEISMRVYGFESLWDIFPEALLR
ncbi:hypothetical protein EST62_12665 [Chlorobaculum sp. 24CR]|uniref:hypothetical protein n=1 Tax=Chlorobaculum sp. 24CR TaxID=2508878 RepID=UPI00100B4A2E|nr:hypothetical protein [Chlorobaculum sp. 24CR]RXK80487.1 hypothetical protein EST62_12665 [Chlorobaculum sp. 24CR]